MNILKRAILSIMRKPGKSILIFLLVFLLSVFLSLGISTSDGLVQTEINLRTRFPTIATLTWESHAMMLEIPTIEMIEAVGALPYVLEYDFRSQSSLFSSTVEWVAPEIDMALIPENMTEEEIIAMQAGCRDIGGFVERSRITGINTPYLIEAQAGFISLSLGRFMTEEELTMGANVAIVSQSFADANHLEIGSTLILENNLFDYEKMFEYATGIGGIMLTCWYWHMDEFKIVNQPVEFEVIGIFEVEREFLYPDDFRTTQALIMEISELYNRIFIPSVTQMELVTDLLPYKLEFSFHEPVFSFSLDQPLFLESLFLLHHPRDIDNFINAADEILSEYWSIADTSAALAPFISAMDSMLWISGLIFRGAFIAAIAILSLVFTLLLLNEGMK